MTVFDGKECSGQGSFGSGCTLSYLEFFLLGICLSPSASSSSRSLRFTAGPDPYFIQIRFICSMVLPALGNGIAVFKISSYLPIGAASFGEAAFISPELVRFIGNGLGVDTSLSLS